MAYPLTSGELPAGEYQHGLRTAQTESRPRQSWINELRLRHGNNLVCAVFRCTNSATNGHGAHLRVSAWSELKSIIGITPHIKTTTNRWLLQCVRVSH